MQDFNYVHSNCFDITIELSCCKYPYGSTLVSEWISNKEAMLKYVEAVHLGVKGLIKDENTGEPIANAVIEIEGISKMVHSTDRGEYWRLLKPNENKPYKMTVTAEGYTTSQPVEIIVNAGTDMVMKNVTLSPKEVTNES